jgi:hypothetical protein
MRIRITRHIPPSYGSEADSLRLGTIHNLDSALASALIADGCAELFEALSDAQKKESTGGALWQAPDRDKRRRRVILDIGDTLGSRTHTGR